MDKFVVRSVSLHNSRYCTFHMQVYSSTSIDQRGIHVVVLNQATVIVIYHTNGLVWVCMLSGTQSDNCCTKQLEQEWGDLQHPHISICNPYILKHMDHLAIFAHELGKLTVSCRPNWSVATCLDQLYYTLVYKPSALHVSQTKKNLRT